MIFKHSFFPSTFPLPIQSQDMSKLTWRSLPIIHNYTKYRKIPKISPVAYIFQRSFLRGLFLKGLIFGGAYTWRGLFSEFYGIFKNVYISVACLAGVERGQEIGGKGNGGGWGERVPLALFSLSPSPTPSPFCAVMGVQTLPILVWSRV